MISGGRDKTDMSDERRLFRASVGGFNRYDVNHYIMEQSREFAEREESMQNEIRELRAETERLRKELSAASSKIEETERLRDALTDAESRCAEQLSRISALEAELEKERAQQAEDRDKDCANLNSRVGDIIVSASCAADDMIKKAEETSKRLVSESERMASEARARVQETLDRIIKELKDDIQSGTDSCIREFRNYADDITYSSKTLVCELERKYDEMTGKINYYKDSLEESVAGKVDYLGCEDTD